MVSEGDQRLMFSTSDSGTRLFSSCCNSWMQPSDDGDERKEEEMKELRRFQKMSHEKKRKRSSQWSMKRGGVGKPLLEIPTETHMVPWTVV